MGAGGCLSLKFSAFPLQDCKEISILRALRDIFSFPQEIRGIVVVVEPEFLGGLEH